MSQNDGINHVSDSTDMAQAPAEAAPPKRRRRWLRRLVVTLLVLIILLGLLIGLLPYIASTPVVSSFALSIVNKRLLGNIELGELSLSWGGPTEISDLRVLDPDGREVLKVSKITAVGGVWQLALDAESFGEIVIDKPYAELHLTADNEITLAQAFQMRQPSAIESETGRLPEPRGNIVIRDGTVHVSRDDGSAFNVLDLSGELELQSLADVAGKLALTLADGGQIAGEVALRGLISEGELSIAGANGTLRVYTDSDIDVRPLMAVVAPEFGLAATANLNVDATLTDGSLQAEFATNVLDLQAGQHISAPGAPVDVSLTGKLNMTPEQVTAQTNLTGEAGSASADISYRCSDQPVTDFAGRHAVGHPHGQIHRFPGILRGSAGARRFGGPGEGHAGAAARAGRPTDHRWNTRDRELVGPRWPQAGSQRRD